MPLSVRKIVLPPRTLAGLVVEYNAIAQILGNCSPANLFGLSKYGNMGYVFYLFSNGKAIAIYLRPLTPQPPYSWEQIEQQ